MDVRSRRTRETSPDRAKVCMQPKVRSIKSVQVVYYLTRNGLLEHPHFMEVTLLAHQQLRLKDIMDRLTVLRGKGMPSLYSWSCKRIYKNGYVWNDLTENDIIHPAEGAEYVLKGTELVEAPSEKLHLLNLNRDLQYSKRKPHVNNQHIHSAELQNNKYQTGEFEEDEDFEFYEEKASYTSSTTPLHSRCSRGVSTKELEQENIVSTHNKNIITTELNIDDSSSPPSSTSTASDKANNSNTESAPPRNSVLLQLIACGSSTVAKAKHVHAQQPLKPQAAASAAAVMVKKREKSLHKGALCKSVAVKMAEEAEEIEMIKYMSENPRFGNLQAEEKEYFSGSIVESMTGDRVVAVPVMKRSNSYNEERNSKPSLEAAVQEEEKKEKVVVRGRCVPRRMSSSCLKPTNK